MAKWLVWPEKTLLNDTFLSPGVGKVEKMKQINNKQCQRAVLY